MIYRVGDARDLIEERSAIPRYGSGYSGTCTCLGRRRSRVTVRVVRKCRLVAEGADDAGELHRRRVGGVGVGLCFRLAEGKGLAAFVPSARVKDDAMHIAV